MYLNFLHDIVYICKFVPFVAERYPIVWTYHSVVNHSLSDGYLGCFQFWATMNNAAMYIYIMSFFVGTF